MIEICREHSAKLKRWRGGMADGAALVRGQAGMAEAAKQFRRMNGHLHLPALQKALETEAARLSDVKATKHEQDVA